jgi:RNA polymerase sigma-70 factor (ECF subfamily)
MRDLPSLAIAAQNGDESAMGALLKALEPIFRGFFIRRIGGRSDVDDLIQNTLVRVARGLDDLKDPARLKGFAMKAALFELQDFYRGRYTGKETLFDALSPPATTSSQPDVGASLDIERALDSLSPRARQIIELREYGYRYEEIAEMVGTTEAAVKMQVKRAFEKLRQIMQAIIVALPWLGKILSDLNVHL